MKILLPVSVAAFTEIAGEVHARGQGDRVNLQTMRIDLDGVTLEANEPARLCTGEVTFVDGLGKTIIISPSDAARAAAKGYRA